MLKTTSAIRVCGPGLRGVFLCFLLAGCSSDREAPGRPTADFDDNPTVLTPSDVRVIGTSESLAKVNDLEVLPDGSVWVLNSVAPFFFGFDPDGNPLGEYGTMGGGPEEFGAPSAFVTGGIGGEAWIFDYRRHSLIRIGGQASARAEIPLPRDSLPPGSLVVGMGLMGTTVRTARLGEEILVARTTRPEGSDFYTFILAILGADIMALHPDTQSVRKVLSLSEVLGDLSSRFEPTEGGFPLWSRLWAVCGGTQLRVHDRLRNEIRSFSSDGTELEPVSLPPVTLTEVTPRQFARAIFGLRQAEIVGDVRTGLTATDSARLLNEIVQGVKGDPEQLANYLPRYVDLRCTDEGTLWVQPFDADAGGLNGGPVWLRIPTGGMSTRFHLPNRFDPLRFTSEGIWGVQRDELDVASVAWIELPGGR